MSQLLNLKECIASVFASNKNQTLINLDMFWFVIDWVIVLGLYWILACQVYKLTILIPLPPVVYD